MKNEKSCGCIILNENNEILIIQQTKGHWGFPKGHMEEGETELETAIREVKEETNIDVRINKNLKYKMKYTINNEINKEVVLFVARNLNNIPKSQEEEVNQILWLNFKDAKEKVTYENTKELLNNVEKDLIKNNYMI